MLGKIKLYTNAFKTKNTKISIQKYECFDNKDGCDYIHSYDDWHCNGCKYKELYNNSKAVVFLNSEKERKT